MKKTVSARQLTTLIAVAVLSAGARVFPGSAANAGRAGVLAAIISLPASLLVAWMLGVLYKKFPNKGLADIFTLSAGGFWGGVFLLVTGLALPLTLAVFSARAHADVFTGTIYPEAPNVFFLTAVTAVTLYITRRGLDRVARLSTVFALILLASLITVFAASFDSISVKNLLPLYTGNPAELIGASLYGLIIPFFLLTGNLLSEDVHNRRYLCREGIWSSAALTAALTLITVICVGVLGAGLTARSVSPVFAAAKAMSVQGIFERVDAFAVVVWIVSDITLLALAGFVFCAVSGYVTDAKAGSHFASPFAFLTFASAIALSGERFAVQRAEGILFGGGAALTALGIFFIIFIAGFVRKF